MKKFILLMLLMVYGLEGTVLVPQKQYWRYQAFLEPSASTLWAYYAGSHARKAFDCTGKKSSAALADIFFNRAEFSTADVFAMNNPLVGNVSFSPRFTYRQDGIDLGYHGQWKITPSWSWGFLVELPIKQIAIHKCQTFSTTSTAALQFFGTPLSNLVQETQTTSGNQTYQTYAYRLDFLSRLPYACTGVGLEYPMVVYSDTDFVNLPLTISNVDITDANNNPVTLLYSQPGTVPNQPYELLQAQAVALPAVNADGSRTGTDARERVATGVDYTPFGASPSNQQEWWVVPTVIPVTVGATTVGQTTVYPARVIREHVDEVLGCLVQQAQTVFSQAGIDFGSHKESGAGDLVTQLFLTYHAPSWWGVRVRGGVIFPTGKKIADVRKIFEQPLGNNGHYELQLGADILIDLPHVASMIYFLCSHACTRCEKVPTAFLGSTIKNIGLPSYATRSWDSVTAGVLVNSMLGHHKRVNLILGYQAFIRSRDHTHYRTVYGYDVLGNQQLLDARVLAQKSSRRTHTFQTQLQYTLWHHMRLDGGCEYTFAGKNAPVVVDWNIGLSIPF